MAKFSIVTALVALSSLVSAQCGSGTPDARVTGSGSSFVATKGSTNVYSGSDYRAAIQAALDSISSGQVSQLSAFFSLSAFSSFSNLLLGAQLAALLIANSVYP